MKSMIAAGVMLASLLSVAGTARAASPILTDDEGRTLYVYDKDLGKPSSVCYNGCAVAWPPYLVEADEPLVAPFASVKRNDGAEQVTYEGRPLYFYVDDAAPGDTSGDGLGGVWHVIPKE